MPGSAVLSDLLGYTSIACWLGAQFPQVLENLRRQSCEGLALPFLANWFLGDFSNLIGCILTHQLPFQRYLATYFVCIDLVLLVQYLYYQSPPKLPALPPPTSYSQRAASVPGARRLSIDRTTTRYRTLSAVAANVAAAAALAAQQDEETICHDRHESDLLLQSDGPYNFTSHLPLARERHQTADIEADGDGATALADSFHSEGGRDIGRKRVSWSIERHRARTRSVGRLSAIAPSLVSSTPSGVGVDSTRRDRSLGRSTEELAEDLEGKIVESLSSPSTAANRRNSRAGKKSATMVFLSAWALFGVGSFVGNKRALPVKTSMNVGKVLSPLGATSSDVSVAVTTILPMAEPSSVSDGITEVALTFEDQDPPPAGPAPPPHGSHPAHPSAERIFGRIFAWLCTTLYLTSRLPQIWKNYVRRSVEGLSMYLFVFAFLGNVFYVSSILSSPTVYLPPPESTEFLKESIPYLLGSAGTLMFDVTIVTQSFIYRPKHKRRYTRSRSNTATVEVGTTEERSGLLAGDALTKHHHNSHHTHIHAPLLPSHMGGTVSVGGNTMTRGRTTRITRSFSDSR